MSIILNIAVLFICLRWLYKSNKNNGVLLGIVFTFIGGTVIGFVLALALEHDYMDGLTH
jgi:RsiW-degrading membrane proteinase PrsW (M82 family)